MFMDLARRRRVHHDIKFAEVLRGTLDGKQCEWERGCLKKFQQSDMENWNPSEVRSDESLESWAI